MIANNIANINTTVFKRARAEFTDLLYQAERIQGVPNRGNEDVVPEGAKLGLGVRSAAVRKLHIQGALARPAIATIWRSPAVAGFRSGARTAKPLFPRRSFNTNATGQLVTVDGYPVDPAINIPQGTVEITVNQTGQVFAQARTARSTAADRPAHARKLRQ